MTTESKDELSRKQANKLSLDFIIDLPKPYNIISSDLKRSIETREKLFIIEGNEIKEENFLLREIYYGSQEGTYFDGMN